MVLAHMHARAGPVLYALAMRQGLTAQVAVGTPYWLGKVFPVKRARGGSSQNGSSTGSTSAT